MASYYCRSCDDKYPQEKDYDWCPVCGENTKYRSDKPDVPEAEAKRRRTYADRHKKFEEWCEENGRDRHADTLRIVMLGPHSERDVLYAVALVDEIERAIPEVVLGSFYVLP